MAKSKKTNAASVPQHDYILLDRSGSMSSIWSDALGGVNAYAQSLAKDKATKDILLTVAVFDSAGPFDVLRKDVPASQWKNILDSEASPRGNTPLFDAVGRLVTVADSDKPDKAAIVIMTDGHENASREHTRDSVNAVLERCRSRGWQVIFLGANFDNAAQGASLGNAYAQTMSVSAENLAATMKGTATMRASYFATGAAMNYSDIDRARAMSGWQDPKAKSRALSGVR